MPPYGDSMFMTHVPTVQIESADDKAARLSTHISCDYYYIILEVKGLILSNSSRMWSAKRLQVFLDMTLFCSVVPDLV
jgi:hypothetical protein